MALWCRDCPLVQARPSESPKAVTLVVPFYENHEFFKSQLEKWAFYPIALLQYLTVIVVDDGSPKPLKKPSVYPLNLRVFRIDVDKRWNWLAARNIGAHHAADGWLLMTDMDHVVPADTLERLIWCQHDPRVVYAFQRREHNGVRINPHSASFFLTREMFWMIGGYDEALSGYYGTDGEYRRRVAEYARIHILSDILERHEYQGDSSTTRYLRKQPEDGAVKKLVQMRPKGWRPKVLSFPFHEVTA